ncbi:tryptophan synthase subunit alpha [uncultured Tepidimonas sp.]|uniref:tryptophan synthase subunit alpha n=1 Tax=Tepidimonas sp. HKU78 TaxID=3414504 RepID=UPI0026332859|nr:tryptophan synthase subunit alpha [uncultured Tepidimonas sp.]
MSAPRLAATFERLRASGRRALIPFVTAGFPQPDVTVDLLHAMVAAGADVIELGVPFSDPMADGPVIQRAGERALAAGIGLAQVLQMVRDFRARDTATPVVLMGYANPIEAWEHRHGAGSFAREAAAAGVDGVLVVDYPPEECEAFAATLRAHGLDLIFLLAPTSTDERIALVGQLASGYVYYVSLKGVTGAAHLDTASVEAMLPRIRAHVKVPVGVGFGIRDAASAQAVARSADAVVIGTRLIQLLDNEPRERAPAVAAAFVRDIRTALDALPKAAAAGA